jgi:RHS repeat-associated protein
LTYEYDAENNRISITEDIGDSSIETDYVVNPHAALSQVLIKTVGNEQTYYVYGLGLIGQEVAGEYSTYHFDLRGSTVALTDANGKVTDRYQYSAYGELLSSTGDTNIPFLYNGRDGVVTDGNGLYYMRARYYNPEIRRFVSQDILLGVVIDGQSLNRYAYVIANPIMRIDPLGLCGEKAFGYTNGGWFGASQTTLFTRNYFGGYNFYDTRLGQTARLNWGRLNSDTVFGISYGKGKTLRLDYGAHGPITTNKWHWNVKGKQFKPYGISNHDVLSSGLADGSSGTILKNTAKVAKYGSRGLVVFGAGMDVYEVATSDEPVQTGLKKAGGWTGAWAGAKGGGALGASIGSIGGPIGTGIGGFVGGLGGGIGGYFAGESIVNSIID